MRIRLVYRDGTEDYAGTVSWPGGRYRFDQLRLSPVDRARIGADSSEAYDLAAHAALSFCANDDGRVWCHIEPTDDLNDFVVGRKAA